MASGTRAGKQSLPGKSQFKHTNSSCVVVVALVTDAVVEGGGCLVISDGK